jgi:hypothetical protein
VSRTDRRGTWGCGSAPGNVAHAGAIIQGNFRTDDHRNFKVVVPLLGVLDNANPRAEWVKRDRVTDPADTSRAAG